MKDGPCQGRLERPRLASQDARWWWWKPGPAKRTKGEEQQRRRTALGREKGRRTRQGEEKRASRLGEDAGEAPYPKETRMLRMRQSKQLCPGALWDTGRDEALRIVLDRKTNAVEALPLSAAVSQSAVALGSSLSSPPHARLAWPPTRNRTHHAGSLPDPPLPSRCRCRLASRQLA